MSQKLLLHTCCAPCLTQSLSVLTARDDYHNVLPNAPDFQITLYYFNPNIHPLYEYQERWSHVRKFALDSGIEVLRDSPQEEEKNAMLWQKAIAGYEEEKERGRRCQICIGFRMRASFEKARLLGHTMVATTLTLSPHKDSLFINKTGDSLSREWGVGYLPSNFKKNNGYQKSIKLSNEHSLYRQNYCGCRYSQKKSFLK